MNIDDCLSSEFDLDDMSTDITRLEYSNELVCNNGTPSSIIDNDYTNSRSNLYELLNKGQVALTDALNVARSTQQPSAFVAVASIMKQLGDINQQLMDVHIQKQQLDGLDPPQHIGNITNNAIFVGTTSELLKQLKK